MEGWRVRYKNEISKILIPSAIVFPNCFSSQTQKLKTNKIIKTFVKYLSRFSAVELKIEPFAPRQLLRQKCENFYNPARFKFVLIFRANFVEARNS